MGRVTDALDGGGRGGVRRRGAVAWRIAGAVVRVALQAAVVAVTLAGAANVTWGVTRLPDHPDADITHFMHWTRVIAVRGLEEAYAGTYPETYLIYPPGSAWAYRGAAEFARRVPKPDDLSPPPLAVEWMRYLKGLPLPAAPPAEGDAPAVEEEMPPGEGDAPPADEGAPDAGPAPATPQPPGDLPAGPTPSAPPPDPTSPPVPPAAGPAAQVDAPGPAPAPDAPASTSPAGDAPPPPLEVAPTDAPAPSDGAAPDAGAPPAQAPPTDGRPAGAPPTDDGPVEAPPAGGVDPAGEGAPTEAPANDAPPAADDGWLPGAFAYLAFELEPASLRREGDPEPPTDEASADPPPPPAPALAGPTPVRSVPGIDDAWLRVAVKLMPAAGHVALAALLFVAVAGASRSFWRGWLAMATYAWNPGPIFDTAYWGQADSFHTALLLGATGATFLVPGWWPIRRDGRWRLVAQVIAPFGAAAAGALTAAAALTKPQAWVFLPFILWIAWKRTGPLGIAAFGAAAGATGLAIVRPWQEAGTLQDALSVFAALTQVMPSVSANGHNLWWLKLGPGALAVYDSLPVGGIGPILLPGHLTFATVGRLGFGAFALLAALRLTGPLNFRVAVTSLAYVASAYFMTITQVHENHQFAAVPFLAAAAALDLAFMPVFLATSVVMFTNMAIHDFLWGAPMTALYLEAMPWLARYGVVDGATLQMANAWANVATFGLFSATFLFRPTTPEQSATYLAWRARLTMVAGLALGGGCCYALWRLVNDRAAAAALWQAFALGTEGVSLIDKHLRLVTTPDARLGRAAVEYVNVFYVFGAVAAIVAWQAALAGATWSLRSMWLRRRERRDEALARAAFRELSETVHADRPPRRRTESWEA